VLFLFKCGLASKVGLRHLSWDNSGGSATSVTLSIQGVYEESRLRKDGRKDSDHSGKVCKRNVIDTKKSCRIILSRGKERV
jgi:hypothetical protein